MKKRGYKVTFSEQKFRTLKTPPANLLRLTAVDSSKQLTYIYHNSHGLCRAYCLLNSWEKPRK